MTLIIGYIKRIQYNDAISSNDIINIISNFLISYKRLYFEHPIDDKHMSKKLKMFVDKDLLSQHWWTMFWIDFIVILIHILKLIHILIIQNLFPATLLDIGKLNLK